MLDTNTKWIEKLMSKLFERVDLKWYNNDGGSNHKKK